MSGILSISSLIRTTPVLLCAAVFLVACRQESGFAPLAAADSTAIVAENHTYRAARAEFFRSDPASPFNRDSAATLGEFTWFPVNPRFRGTSILHRYDNPARVNIAGTGGEIRKQIRYGYFEFPVPDSAGGPVTIRLNVYKNAPEGKPRSPQYAKMLSIWFTDLTTGTETYGVGRYVDIEDEHPDTDHLYTIDLNMAYNPFCAYSEVYSCAIPAREDHVPVPIRVGEKPYPE